MALTTAEELFKDTLMGISQDALRYDYDVMLLSARPHTQSEEMAAKVLRSGIEALIVISATAKLQGFTPLRKRNFPIVFLGKRQIEELDTSQINLVATFNPADPCWELIAESATTAYFAASPEVGLTPLKFWQTQQLSVPLDRSLLVFDDFPTAVLESPAITVLKQDMKALGKLSVQLVMDILEKKSESTKQLYVSTQLIERHSCAVRKAT